MIDESGDAANFTLVPSEDSDEGYLIGFQFDESDIGVLWVNWAIAETFPVDDTGNLFLLPKGSVSSWPTIENGLRLDKWPKAQLIAEGFLKWDGCAQWECDVHLDSRLLRQQFFAVVDRAHLEAAKLMTHFDGPVDEA